MSANQSDLNHGKKDLDANRPDAPSLTRRRFVAMTGGMMAALGAGLGAEPAEARASNETPAEPKSAIEPFWGEHQAGIVTPAQGHSFFAAFELNCADRAGVVQLLQTWTEASSRLTQGLSVAPLEANGDSPGTDTGETLGLPPARLTLTFGLGPTLFVKNGQDRFGLARHRPDALINLPVFKGDQLQESLTGGDISVQACADDPQVAFHAIRQLSRLAYGAASIRWVQSGFLPKFGPEQTPRNLMGFKDGINNPSTEDDAAMAQHVWVGEEGPAWMRGGSYLVVRRIRIALEHWDRMTVSFQEQVVGRKKYSGAPLTGKAEFDSVDLAAADADGNSVIPDNSHIRLAAAATNNGVRILRRPYSYNDGVNFVSERWPPWRQGMEYDAGLFFACYQRDPRTGFVSMFEKISTMDMLNQFATHTGGGLFACPGGINNGDYLAKALLELT